MFEDWPTLDEAVQRTKISKRSFYRMIEDNEIQRQYRREVGKKPIVVVDPDKVKNLEGQVMHPIPDSPLPAKVSQSDIAALLTGLREALALIAERLPYLPALAATPEEKPTYVNVKQAAKLSGLPERFIRRKIRDHAIPAILTGSGYRIKREAIVNFSDNGRNGQNAALNNNGRE